MRGALRVKRSCGTHTSSMSCVPIDVIRTPSVVEVRHRQYFSEIEHYSKVYGFDAGCVDQLDKLRFGPSLHLATMSAQGRECFRARATVVTQSLVLGRLDSKYVRVTVNDRQYSQYID